MTLEETIQQCAILAEALYPGATVTYAAWDAPDGLWHCWVIGGEEDDLADITEPVSGNALGDAFGKLHERLREEAETTVAVIEEALDGHVPTPRNKLS
jgi:hypothetical protein